MRSPPFATLTNEPSQEHSDKAAFDARGSSVPRTEFDLDEARNWVDDEEESCSSKDVEEVVLRRMELSK